MPGRIAQSVGHLTRKSGVLGSIPGLQHTFVSPSAFSRRAVVSYWRKYVHEVLVNRLGGLSLPRKSVVRLTDRPDMTLDVYRGRKTTMQQQQQKFNADTWRYLLRAWVLTVNIMRGETIHREREREREKEAAIIIGTSSNSYW